MKSKNFKKNEMNTKSTIKQAKEYYERRLKIDVLRGYSSLEIWKK